MTMKVFISYAREDHDAVLRYYDAFTREGASPWMDTKELLPGQNWEAEISRAFSEANIIALFLSPRSVSKRGFVQREANDAIDRLRYKQPTDIYVIPLLLEPCEVPLHIAQRLQFVDLTTDGAWGKVTTALAVAAEQQSIQLVSGTMAGPFVIFDNHLVEKWEGAPGYEVDIKYPRFESTTNPAAAREISAVFLGRAYARLIKERQNPWNQTPELFASRQSSIAMNGRWEGFGIAHATSKLLSLTYEVGWYFAGAAHPNMFFETYTYALSTHTTELQLIDFFFDPALAAKRISEICVKNLSSEYWDRTGEIADKNQLEWFQKGAGPDINNFAAFTVSSNCFTFLFSPYQVAAYALGRWAVDVAFHDLLDLLKVNGPHQFAVMDDQG